MLGIPLLSTYIQRIVKVQTVADSVDWLHYYCTSLLLAFFALAISAKQYFGSPIQCWCPNEFKGSWERYTENYCFVANSYFVPLHEEVPRSMGQRHDQISYYRWVPVALAVQALLFWLPNWLWAMAHKQTAINPRALLQEAAKSRALHGADREKEVQGLATFVGDTLSAFSEEQPRRRSGMNATVLYLCLKLLYVLNCFGQLVVLNRFLGGQYHSWAWETLTGLLRGEEWRESVVFPRVILCDFSIRRLANPQQHTVQCVIMLNLINEKLYFFLHFWFLLIGFVTLVNFLYYLAMLMLPSLRTSFVKKNIDKRQQKLRGFGTRELHRFVQSRLRPDGVLLLHFLRQHVGGRITYELLNELLRLHWLAQTAGANGSGIGCTRSAQLTSTSKSSNASCSPNSSEKAMLLMGRRGSAEDADNDPRFDGYSRQNTYKPTEYGPGALVYPTMGLASAPPPFSPASLLRAISGTASPSLGFLPNGNGNHYTVPPTLDFIDGMASQEQQPTKQHLTPNGTALAAKSNQQSPSTTLNATPLTQSRRAKSPLVTGLGTIGKRQNVHDMRAALAAENVEGKSKVDNENLSDTNGCEEGKSPTGKQTNLDSTV